jgi:8-oxo-dGTP diphosphatase
MGEDVSAIRRENVVTIKAFVVRDGRFLCIQDARGRWDAPGGRIECPETILDALRREIREELGVELATIDVDHPWIWDWQFESQSRPLIQNIVGIGFSCTLASDALHPDPDECVAQRWVTAAELQALHMHEGHKAGYMRWMQLQKLA